MPWQPRSDEVFKCLWQLFQQCTQCNYLPVGVPAGGQLPVGICSSVTLPTEEQNLPLPVGICTSISLPVGICTVVSGGVEVTGPIPLPVGICSSAEVPVEIADVNLPAGTRLPVGICTSVEIPVGICQEVLVEIADVSTTTALPVGICSSVEIPVGICEEVLVEISDINVPEGASLPVGICSSTQLPIGICESVRLGRDRPKTIEQLWGAVGVCVAVNGVVRSSSIELEDVDVIAFTVQRFAGHCGFCVSVNLQTSPDDANWDTEAYAGFTNLAFGVAAGLSGQSTLPITAGPRYIRAEIENESMNEITVRAWLTITT